jgi:phosphatidylglycerophosphate synthase
MLAVYIGQGHWTASVILIVGLQVGYAFDCADGPLARATGQSSSFGILMDKLVDLSSGMIFPCIIAYGAGHFYFNGNPSTVKVLISILILRVVHSVMMWMKELVVYKADRLKNDPRNQTLWWKVKKAVSLYIDEPIYRFGVAVAWSFSCFWEFFVPYNIGVFVIALVYLFSSKKEMDQMDRRKSGNLEA